MYMIQRILEMLFFLDMEVQENRLLPKLFAISAEQFQSPVR